MAVSSFGIIPPCAVPSSIRSRILAIDKSVSNRFSLSITPSTSVIIIKREAESAPAFEDFVAQYPADTRDNRSLIFGRRGNSWHGVKRIRCPENHYREVFIVVYEEHRPARMAVKRLKRLVTGKELKMMAASVDPVVSQELREALGCKSFFWELVISLSVAGTICLVLLIVVCAQACQNRSMNTRNLILEERQYSRLRRLETTELYRLKTQERRSSMEEEREEDLNTAWEAAVNSAKKAPKEAHRKEEDEEEERK